MEDAKVEVRLQANCGCGATFRVGDGKCFDEGQVMLEATAHASHTRHKMELFGRITPEQLPIIVPDKPKDRSRFVRDPRD